MSSPTKSQKLPEYLAGFIDCLDEIPDHRATDNQNYSVAEIVFVAVVAIFAGCNNWEDIEAFGKQKIEFLRRYLSYKNGCPSDDTLRRFFRILDGQILSECLSSWLKEILKIEVNDNTIAIDGKTLCGSKTKDQRALHTISAYLCESGITLNQLAVDCKTNEITAIPQLLEMIDIKGSVVTSDAMGCQTDIIAKIRQKEADYFIALKGNQGSLHKEVESSFSMLDKSKTLTELITCDSYETTEKNRGRIETRQCDVIYNAKQLDSDKKWQDLKAIIRIKATIEAKGKTTQEVRYYITSLNDTAERMLERARKHWLIESNHFILDVSFSEDRCRINIGNTPYNIAILRRFVLNIIQEIKPGNISIALFRKSAGWNDATLTMFVDKLTKLD